MPRRRVERREELVFREHVRRGERVEERGLAGVGVADDGDDRHHLRRALPPLHRALLPHDLQLTSQLRDARANAPPVDLQLRLTGTAHADRAADAAATRAARAAADAREVAPAPGQPRQPVFELRQLHLQLALARAGVLREDVQNQRGAVDDARFSQRCEIALLGRGDLVVDDDEVEVLLAPQLRQLQGATLADVVRRIGRAQPLCELADDRGASGAGERRQLIERIVDIPEPLFAGELDADQKRALGAILRGQIDHPAVAYRSSRGLLSCYSSLTLGAGEPCCSPRHALNLTRSISHAQSHTLNLTRSISRSLYSTRRARNSRARRVWRHCITFVSPVHRLRALLNLYHSLAV